jgi:hypothetical protein
MKKIPVPRYDQIGVKFLDIFQEANNILWKRDGSLYVRNYRDIISRF